MPATRVLFVGNSRTYFNGGVERHLARMSPPSHPIDVHAVTRGGATLSQLWRKVPEVKRALSAQRFDVLVLQEDMPELRVTSDFDKYAAKLVCFARDCGVQKIVFYMCWAYTRLPDVTDGDIQAAHRRVGHRLGVDVAPVGVARQLLSAGDDPCGDLLWDPDMEHPSPAGTLLAAACLLRTVFRGEASWSPEAYLPEDLGVTRDLAIRLCDAAEACSPPADTSWCFASPMRGEASASPSPSAQAPAASAATATPNEPAATAEVVEFSVATTIPGVVVRQTFVVLGVAKFLGAEDLTEMLSACRGFFGIVCATLHDERLWGVLYKRDFPLSPKTRVLSSWRKAYLLSQEMRALEEMEVGMGLC